MPGMFIPLLEQNGTIMELDMYMLEQACKLIQKWTENGQMPVPISVNISPLNIYKNDFIERITGITEKYHTPPCLIELELDETIVFENSRFLMEYMMTLSEMGFRLAVDNFGSGYTSLKLLKDMPISLIKLDRDFLKGEEVEKERTGIVLNNIVHMAHELGMLIISGGIENKEHVRLLKKVGCNYGMGFLFSRPMPLSQFEGLTL